MARRRAGPTAIDAAMQAHLRGASYAGSHGLGSADVTHQQRQQGRADGLPGGGSLFPNGTGADYESLRWAQGGGEKESLGMELSGRKECLLECNCYEHEGKMRGEVPSAHVLKYIGVRMRGKSRWVAEIKDNSHNVRKWLGTFGCPVQAAQAFDAAARALRGVHTRANFKLGDRYFIRSIADLPRELITEPLAELMNEFPHSGQPNSSQITDDALESLSVLTKQSRPGKTLPARHSSLEDPSDMSRRTEPGAHPQRTLPSLPSFPSVNSVVESTRPQQHSTLQQTSLAGRLNAALSPQAKALRQAMTQRASPQESPYNETREMSLTEMSQSVAPRLDAQRSSYSEQKAALSLSHGVPLAHQGAALESGGAGMGCVPEAGPWGPLSQGNAGEPRDMKSVPFRKRPRPSEVDAGGRGEEAGAAMGKQQYLPLGIQAVRGVPVAEQGAVDLDGQQGSMPAVMQQGSHAMGQAERSASRAVKEDSVQYGSVQRKRSHLSFEDDEDQREQRSSETEALEGSLSSESENSCVVVGLQLPEGVPASPASPADSPLDLLALLGSAHLEHSGARSARKPMIRGRGVKIEGSMSSIIESTELEGSNGESRGNRREQQNANCGEGEGLTRASLFPTSGNLDEKGAWNKLHCMKLWGDKEALKSDALSGLSSHAVLDILVSHNMGDASPWLSL